MANEAEKLVNSGLIAQLAYGVPPAAVSQILESGGSIDDAMRRLEQYEDEAEESGFELDFDIDDLYDQFETISQINGTAPFPVRDEAEVAAIVDENPELLDMAELVAATIENPDDLDEFEMLVDDIDAAMSNLSDDVVDNILSTMDSKDSFIGLEKVISDIETSVEQMGSMGESLSNWVAEVDTILKPSIVLEASGYETPETTDPVSTGTAPLGGWEDPEDYVRSPWIDPGGDIGVTGDNKEIWDSMNPAQQKEILEVGWENYDWDNFWKNREIDFADADEVELPPEFNFDVYSGNWYNELSDIEKGKFEQYMFVESGLDIDKDTDWKGMIERGTSPDLELSLTMSNLWQQWKKLGNFDPLVRGGKLDVNAAIAKAEETSTGFPGFPYDPTMVAGTGGSGYKDEYDDDGKVIYNPNIHGSVTDSEGNKQPIPVTGNFFWDSGSEFNFETGPAGQAGYNRVEILDALKPYLAPNFGYVDWFQYFSEAYTGNSQGEGGYLQSASAFDTGTRSPWMKGAIPDAMGESYGEWLGYDIQEKLSAIEDMLGAEVASKEAGGVFATLFTGIHGTNEQGNHLLEQLDGVSTASQLFRVASGALQGRIINPNWDPKEGAPQAQWYQRGDIGKGKSWLNDIATAMPDIALYFGAEKGEPKDTDLRKGYENIVQGWTWDKAKFPSFETLSRGYDLKYGGAIDPKSAFGQAYLADILGQQKDERDKFDKAFGNTNPMLMGYSDMQDALFEDASIARFLNDEGYQEQTERYQGMQADHLWPTEKSDTWSQPEKLYNLSGWEQDTGYYERYINNRNEEAEKLYDNAFELADFLADTAWMARGEDFARDRSEKGVELTEGAMASQVYETFNLNPDSLEDRRKYAQLQVFNPLVYAAGSDNYTSAEAMIKQMALSSTLPVGANPYQRQLHRSMIDQRYNEWVNSNNNPNEFLKYWLESGRIKSTKSSYYEPETEQQKKDPKYYWNKYIQDEFGDGPDPIKRYREFTPNTEVESQFEV